MATGSATSQAAGITEFATGVATGDGTALTITVGFKARAVQVFDVTGVIMWEWMEGMPATNTIKTIAAGTMAVDTGSAIVVNTDGRTITVSSGANVSAHALVWAAQG